MKENIQDLALRMQAVIDTAIDGIITIDDKGIVETINKSAADLFEYPVEEVIGNNISMLMPEPYKSSHDEYIERYKRTRQARIIGIGREVVGRKKSGQVFPFRLAVGEVILNDRIIFTGIVHDLTDIKEAEEALRLSNENLEHKVEQRTNQLESVVNKLLFTNKQLEQSRIELEKALEKEKELNELKSRFVSMASHEFRTPLSAIMSSASIISKYEEGEDQEKRMKHVNRIKSSVDNLTGILNDFLSLSKLEEDKIIVKKEEVHLKELFDKVKDEIQSILKTDQNISVEYSQLPGQLYSDEQILKNILFNLISNAIKYSDSGSKILCTVEDKKGMIQINVIDEGIGIPFNDQKYLFDRFFRASNVENIQGTGLGLNIVKRYIELLEGQIKFKSKPGEGTTFTVIIPMK